MTLALKNVSVKASGTAILDSVSFDIKPGSVTTIIGPNGAGKSTALSVLAGDFRPAAGVAMLDDVPLEKFSRPYLATRRAVVTQHAPLNFPFKVHEVVTLSCSAALCDEWVEQTLVELDLLHLANRSYTTLSGGERQRVLIARAMAQVGPLSTDVVPYLLMDEPTAHLDLKHQIQTLQMARQFANRGGGVLFILHDIWLARDFSDYVILMEKGRLKKQGSASSTVTAANVASLFDIEESYARIFEN